MKNNQNMDSKRTLFIFATLLIFIFSCSQDETASEITIEKSLTLPSAEGAEDGSIDLTVSGGKGPYTFTWSNDASSEDLANLSANLYIVTVKDAEGTLVVDSIHLYRTLNLELKVTDESYTGAEDGILTAEVSGGIAPYKYVWDNEAGSATNTNLMAGEYTCTVIDTVGNSTSKSASVTQVLTLDVPSSLNYITYYKQSSLRIDDNGTILYFDPAFVPNNGEDAAFICTSHAHNDHKGKATFGSQDAIYISPQEVKSNYSNCTDKNYYKAVEGSSFTIGNITIDVVPAYNSHHNRESSVGFVVTLSDGTVLYFMGDTGLIPEMSDIDCDIVFAPLGQKYTMASVDDAATAVKNCGAETVIPIHFGLYEGKKSDVVTLYNLLKSTNIQVIVLGNSL